uniref:Uncharacterized protein n=1 Tax=Rhizophora mucronata TaxID=61149 RepID=A0A2P2IL57_RHIMU
METENKSPSLSSLSKHHKKH